MIGNKFKKYVNLAIIALIATAIGFGATNSSPVLADDELTVLTIGGSFTAKSRFYNGTKDAELESHNLTLIGVKSGDEGKVDLGSIVIEFNSSAPGFKVARIVGAELTGDAAGNYNLSLYGAPTYGDNDVDIVRINSKEIKINDSSTVTVSNKTYDGTAIATVDTHTLELDTNDIIGGEEVVIGNITAQFNDKDVGDDKEVKIINIELGGNDGGNYSINSTEYNNITATANISKADIIVTASDKSKVYGDPDPELTYSHPDLFHANDTFVGSLTRVSGENVGEYDINIDGSINDNYNVIFNKGVFSIAKKGVNVEGSFTANDKIYDGEVVATINEHNLSLNNSDIIGSDVVALGNVIAEFNDKKVGNGKEVKITSVELSGSDGGNYEAILYSGVLATTGSITSKGLTITGDFTASNKFYDGNTDANISNNNLSLEGVVPDDVVNLDNNIIVKFDNKNAGSKNVSIVSAALAGIDHANYALSLEGAPTTTGTITAKKLSIGDPALTTTKLYDGNGTAAATAGSLNGVIGGEVVNVSATASYNDKTVDTGKTITVSYALTGDHNIINNYEAPDNYTTTGSITAKGLNIIGGFTAENRPYNGDIDATIDVNNLTPDSNNIIENDDVTLGNVVIKFDTKDIGYNKEVRIVSVELSGNDGGNYEAIYSGVSTAHADITAKKLSIGDPTLTTTKVYDGYDTAAVTADNLNGVIGGEVVNVSATASYNDKTVDTGKTITVSYALTGDSNIINNYEVPDNYTTTGSITAKELNITGDFTAKDRSYNGGVSATMDTNNLNLNNSDIISGDIVTLGNVVIEFDTKDTGSNKEVRIVSAELNGTDKGNYEVVYSTAPTATARIYSSGGGFIPSVQTPVADTDSSDGSEEAETPGTGEGSSDSGSNTEAPSNISEVIAEEQSLMGQVNPQLTNRLAGRILLQVENRGQAWYLEPGSGMKHFMGRPADAFSLMRHFGLGVSEANFNAFESNGVPARLAGRILLRVEASGEAYYINPVDMKMHYLGRPADAFRIMRELALGISNENIRQILVADSIVD